MRSKPNIFEGVTFIFTGLKPNKGVLNTNVLGTTIESHGGKVGDFPDDPGPTEPIRTDPFVTLPSRILIADKERRTLKYLLALATGVPCVQPLWVKHCSEQGCALPFLPYLLPAGYSLAREELLYLTYPKCNILADFTVTVLGSDDFIHHWDVVLKACGAQVVMCDMQALKSCDVIVSDPFPQADFKKAAKSLKVPIVAVEWVIQCLINQHPQPLDGHPRYHYGYLRDHYHAAGVISPSK